MGFRVGDFSTMLDELADSLRELAYRLTASVGDLIAGVSVWYDGLDQPVRIAMVAGAGAMLLLLMTSLFRRRSHAFRASKRDLKRRTRPARMLGYASAILFVGGTAAWSSVALLASAVVANGVVSPEGYRKTVQHLEGGIISKIYVKEGDKVAAGHILISLKTTQAQGHYDELQTHYIRLLATEARLVAELAGQDRITFPKELTSIDSDIARKVVVEEQALLDSRLATRAGRTQILNKRIAQIEEQSTGARDVIAAEAEQLKLIDQEIASAQEMYNKGLERLPRILALQRAQADIRANQASNRAQVAK
ncbi:MAG: HlyD family type I secretion periplasmic adaptor subunit, partial [Mesorhizobium sp.]